MTEKCFPCIAGILQKGPYLPCVSMAGRALLAGYHRYVREIHQSPVVSLTKGQLCGLWRFLWCQPKHTVEQTIKLSVIRDAMMLIWHHCYVALSKWNSLGFNVLTHWGRVMHTCVSKFIGSDNGLSPGRRQAIIWNNAEILLIGPLGTNFSQVLIRIQTFSSKKINELGHHWFR